jgi:5-methylcytosine-specific restriction endonuclease McrA
LASCRCGALLVAQRRGANPRRWCSASCRARYARYPDGLTDRTCPHCLGTFQAAGSKKLYCSRQCGWLARGRLAPKSEDWASGHQPERVASCGVCGNATLTRTSNVRCGPCRVAGRRAVSARKRSKRRGAVLTGRYTLPQIGERDEWICHLCSGAVDASLSGMAQDGPTIDHLIPISLGGADGPDNVRLAHRRCNSRRGAAPLAEAAA